MIVMPSERQKTKIYVDCRGAQYSEINVGDQILV